MPKRGRKVVSRTSYVKGEKVGETLPGRVEKVYAGTTLAQWTCSSCGHEGIPGNVKKCPGCGSPKEDEEVYQPPEKPGQYLSGEELTEMGVDPSDHYSDEKCPYCEGRLKPGTTTCPNCGGAIGDEPEVAEKSQISTVRPYTSLPQSQLKFALPQVELGSKIFALAGTALVLVIIFLAAFLIFKPRFEAMTVNNVSWERIIYVEEHQYNQREGWNFPSGG